MKSAGGDQAVLFLPRRNGDAVVGYDAPVAPDPVRMARATDPSSSHEAAEAVTRSGAAATNSEAVEAALARRPWATSLELFCLDRELRRHLRNDRAEVNRRLDTLFKEGRIVRMTPQDNPTLRPCRAMPEAVGRKRLCRWARQADVALAPRELESGSALPQIDLGAGDPVPTYRGDAA